MEASYHFLQEAALAAYSEVFAEADLSIAAVAAALAVAVAAVAAAEAVVSSVAVASTVVVHSSFYCPPHSGEPYGSSSGCFGCSGFLGY